MRRCGASEAATGKTRMPVAGAAERESQLAQRERALSAYAADVADRSAKLDERLRREQLTVEKARLLERRRRTISSFDEALAELREKLAKSEGERERVQGELQRLEAADAEGVEMRARVQAAEALAERLFGASQVAAALCLPLGHPRTSRRAAATNRDFFWPVPGHVGQT